MNTVYLAGPIAGLDYAGATDWRIQAEQKLATAGIKGLSPMRAKKYLADVAEFSATCGPENGLGPLSGPRAVMTRDRFDATRCDVLLVNLLGATRVSIGTAMEIAWADLCRTPVVLVMEAHGNVHGHAMLVEAAGFRVETLDAGLDVIIGILS
jgi:nucleoside 2-deoxyribosyltransferase